MPNNLKPCPFCGSHDVAVMREGKSDGNAAYRVVCRQCLTRGPKHWVRPWHYGNKFVAQGKAVVDWNKRPGSRQRGCWSWFENKSGNPSTGYDDDWGWECSVCHTILPDDYDNPDKPPTIPFCPNCGAKMDLEVKNK